MKMALNYSAIETKKNKIHSRHAQPKSDIDAQRKISKNNSSHI